MRCQAPRIREFLRTQITFVVTYSGVRGHVVSEVTSGQTTLSTCRTPTGVSAIVCGLMTTKDVFRRKAPTTERTPVFTRCW